MRRVTVPVVGWCHACGARLNLPVHLRVTEEWAARYERDVTLRFPVDREVIRTALARHIAACPGAATPAQAPHREVAQALHAH